MKSFIISLNIDSSRQYTQTCIESILKTKSNLEVEIFNATTPETLFDVEWTWPTYKKKTCPSTGLLLTAYRNADIKKRIACAQSHYNLWQKCIDLNEPILILEHDAFFIKKFECFDFDGGALSINSPIDATFNSTDYDQKLTEQINEIPWVTDQNIPQGLPGHSAYIIKPWAAKKLIKLQYTIGWWPNDAIMCKQLCPWLRAHKPYYTRVQGIKSTTIN